MDVATQIKKFGEFIESNYYNKLVENITKGHKFLVIDFSELVKFDPSLADLLLEQPEEVVKAAEIAIEQFDIEGDLKNVRVRVKNLPSTQGIEIKNIRSNHLAKLIVVLGLVRQKSDVRPQVTSARFECPSCGNIITVLQLEAKFIEPTRCGCGRKGKFRLLSKELVDAQKIVLEEAPEDLEGGEQPKRINVFLKADLVSPLSEKQTNPGSKVLVAGVLNEVPIPAKEGGKLTRFDLMIEANYVEPIEEDFSQITITPEEEKQIMDLANDPKVHAKLVSSIAPSIYGHEEVKEALLMQIVGGVKKTREDGVTTRGDMHILLIGDPGSGKSQMLKRISIVAPKSRYVSGKGASGAGLTASVVKDEFLRGWALEAGALVLTNKGLCCIDELDKMTKEDTAAMHEALEQQTISISKANIQATLRAETTVLAAANPKFGRFDPYEMIAKQIDLPSTLINRFDLIFPIRDLPNKDRDEKMASFILNMHQTTSVGEIEIPTEFLRKYLAYAKQKVVPKLTDAALQEIKDFYVKMRSSGGEGEIKPIPVSARQLEALVRLSEASAKLRLGDKVLKKDAKRAIELLQYCLSNIGVDPRTGKIDIDVISTGIPSSERSRISQIKEIISSLEEKIGKIIPIEDIVMEASEKGIEKSEVEEVIDKLKRAGDLFEPKRNFIQKI
jgi:replicative DNA helicase Mcm